MPWDFLETDMGLRGSAITGQQFHDSAMACHGNAMKTAKLEETDIGLRGSAITGQQFHDSAMACHGNAMKTAELGDGHHLWRVMAVSLACSRALWTAME